MQGATYYFRVVAQNAGGIAQGSIVSCTTAQPISLPSVSTYGAISVTGTGAQLNGSAIPNGLTTVAWFEWGTSSTLATYTSTGEQNIGDGLVSVAVNNSLTGLTTGQTYYYRIAARNSIGTVQGNIASFITGTSPTVTTQAATSILDQSATLNGAVSPNGFATTAWFEYSNNSSLTPHDTTAPQALPSVTGSFSINVMITGLSPASPYYFRVVAQNPAGSQFGLIMDFTTTIKVSLWDQMVWDQDNWQ
jgi:phosphodiesterase/alkaline phosphatase D-like protein